MYAENGWACSRDELSHGSVKRLARSKGCTAAELVFAFARQVGMLPLTGTSDALHMQKDLGAVDMLLEPTEVQLLETLNG